MTKLTITIEFEIGQIVYLVTDTNAIPMMVTFIRLDAHGILYGLESGFAYYNFQLCKSPSITFAN